MKKLFKKFIKLFDWKLFNTSYREILNKSDEEAIKSDWEAIFEDLNTVINKKENNDKNINCR